MFNRALAIDQQLLKYLDLATHAAPPPAPLRAEAEVSPGSRLTGAQLLDLADAQMTCRHLDLIARELRSRDAGYYTIASSGHEGNAVLGALVRHTDPTFLHYRSGALMMQRSKQVPGIDPILDTLLSQAASADDPIAGGRHKVWGSKPLWVPPQTSTIASHLPKAVGAAIAIDRARKLKLTLPVPADSIVLCTFGDASVNHSAAQGAFNSAAWAAYQKVPVPALFVCEDNGIGISVHTPPGWIEHTFRQRYGWQYFFGDGLDLPDAYEAAARAVEHCRTTRTPTFLHLRTIRMTGHAGSDVETNYHSLEEIAAVEARDPLLATARRIVDSGLMTAAELKDRYEEIRRRVAELAEDVVRRPKLTTVAAVMAPLSPLSPEDVSTEACRVAAVPNGTAPLAELSGAKHLAVLINRGLHEMLEKYPNSLVFGEDVARKGGVYNVTTGLFGRFGAARVFNTLLDETTILGLGLGAAHVGFLPIPEIQYLAYVHNAEDQLRSEACSLQFFSNDQFRNPCVVRMAGLAYQKGFGGHFHNDNSLAVLRDIPGLIIAVPTRGDDAVKMLRTCMALAQVDGRVVVFLEPIALYMTKDLYAEGDGLWQTEYPPQGQAIGLGEGSVYNGQATDLTIATYGNGLYMSLRATRRLAEEQGINARVLDLRWLNPLNHDWIAEHAKATGKLLVVDECRRAGGLGEAIVAGVTERAGSAVKVMLVAAEDTYVPLGPAMTVVMPTDESIQAAASRLASGKKPRRVNA
ncbi:MAG: thiamine pyrophosphate-dependent enzyme [Acidobacteriota bacterium]